MTIQANIPFVIQSGYNEFSGLNCFDEHGGLIAGIYSDISNDDYHSLPALSSSGLKKFANSPAKYKRDYIDKIIRLKTTSRENTFERGEMTHGYVLEPERTKNLYWYNLNPSDYPNAIHTIDEIKDAIAAKGAKPKGTKKSDLIDQLLSIDPNAQIFDVINHHHVKTWVISKNLPWAAHIDPQNIHLTPEYQSFVEEWVTDPIIYSDANRATETIKNHRLASRLFSNGIAELTMLAKDPDSGLWLKCKFDWLRFDLIAVDLKTTRSTNPDDWAYQASDLGYDLQDAFYCYVACLCGIEIKAFPFVCVEFAELDNCEVYELSSRTRSNANMKMKYFIKEFNECKNNNYWYGYNKSQSVTVIDF
jgi:exodeoxyribonuclease VIII